MIDMVSKTEKGGKSKQKDAVLEQKSPAEFFADNRNIAGFDNVSRGGWGLLPWRFLRGWSWVGNGPLSLVQGC